MISFKGASLLLLSLWKVAAAALSGTGPRPQPNVYSDGKQHALYLWIHLNPNASIPDVIAASASLQTLVDKLAVPPDDNNKQGGESNEVWAGVGFGTSFYNNLANRKRPNLMTYVTRKGKNGLMPSTGGDIFVHAKSDRLSKLIDLAAAFNDSLPASAKRFVSATYSFVFQNGRDLSGFIDGTENPATSVSRFDVAVEKSSGGSFCITQKWVHRFDVIQRESRQTLEGFVGRSIVDSAELPTKPATAHVARMTSGPEFKAYKPVQIVRQSMPYSVVDGEAGLFFIGFAADINNFEYMLNRMVGSSSDGLSDDIMRLSHAVSGNYWYFPSQEELDQLRQQQPV